LGGAGNDFGDAEAEVMFTVRIVVRKGVLTDSSMLKSNMAVGMCSKSRPFDEPDGFSLRIEWFNGKQVLIVSVYRHKS
jgi:hypothetical protein